MSKYAETFYAGTILALSMFLFFATPKLACAGEPTQEQVNMTYALTYGLVAYELKLPRMGEFNAPIIRLVTGAQLCEQYGVKAPCNIRGLQENDTIFLSTDLDYQDPVVMSFVVHEFVHYFQYVARGVIPDWCENFRREIQAYGVQGEVLRKIKGDTRAAIMNTEGQAGLYRARQLQEGCVK